MHISVLLTLVTSFLLAYLVVPPIVRVSRAKHLFDVPDERKLNKHVVPTLGGVAIFIGSIISILVYLQGAVSHGFRYLFAAIIIMFFIGIKDDIMIISARKKFVVQLVTAVMLVVLGDYRIVHVYGFAGMEQLNEWASVPFTVLLILFLVNAMNLIDGVDGLASGIALYISAMFGTWFYFTGHLDYSISCFALAGSLLAFLRYNLWGGHNKVFMGDTGSLILGIFLSVVVISFNELNYQTYNNFYVEQAPLLALGLFIVPVTDTLRVFTIRLYHNRSPFSPDMNHFHHLLIRLGLSHIQVSSFLIAYSVLFTLMAVTLQNYLDITISMMLLFAASFTFVGLIYNQVQQRERSLDTEDSEQADDRKVIRLFGLKKVPVEDTARRKRRI